MSNLTLPLVLITNTAPPEVLAPLDGVARFIQGPAGGDLMPRAEVLRLAPALAGIINQAELRVDAELLAAAPQLKIVANVAMGINNFDLNAMRSRGVIATNVPAAFTESTADCTWDGTLLHGKTLGLVGYGRIAQAVESRACAFGMRVIHYRRAPDGAPGYTPLDALLAQSDFVSLHTPLNADSDRLINAARLAQMKRGAFLINMARGRVVDEAALVTALQSGHLSGAGLDVFEDEPRVHPALLTMSQVVLAPHLGGGTKESRFQARLLCAQNIAAVLQGQPPLTPV
jgi:glyoxylate reductase